MKKTWDYHIQEILHLKIQPISTHSTATPGIPPTSTPLKKNSFESNLWVEPTDFTPNLLSRLRSLYTQ